MERFVILEDIAKASVNGVKWINFISLRDLETYLSTLVPTGSKRTSEDTIAGDLNNYLSNDLICITNICTDTTVTNLLILKQGPSRILHQEALQSTAANFWKYLQTRFIMIYNHTMQNTLVTNNVSGSRSQRRG